MGCMHNNERPSHQLNKTQVKSQKNPQLIIRQGTKDVGSATPDRLKHPSLQQLISRQSRLRQQKNSVANMQVNQVLLGTKDRRQSMDKKIRYPFNCIGLLYFSNIFFKDSTTTKEYVATGFLVAPNIVMTAAHFIEVFKKMGKQMKFLMQTYKDQEFQYSCLQAKKMVHYSFHNDYDSINKQIRQDYALVYLEESIPRTQYICLAANFKQTEVDVHVYGYPTDFIKQQFRLVGMKGIIKSIENSIVQYDIDTSVRQNGSPILVQYMQDQYIAIGIHSGKDTKDKYSCGCLFTQEMIQIINQWAKSQNKVENKNKNQKQLIERPLQHQNEYLQIYSKDFVCLNLLKSNISIFEQLKRLQPNPNQVSGQNLSPLQQSSLAFAQQKYHLSIAYAQKALQLPNIHQGQKFELFSLIGKNYHKLLQFDLAIFYYSQCLNCNINQGIVNNITLAKTLNCVGNAFLELNQTERAKKYFRKAKNIRKGLIQKEDEKIDTLIDEGSVSLVDGNVLKAYNMFKSAKVSSFKSDQLSQQKAFILNSLAITSFSLKRIDEWLEYSFASLWILTQMNLTRQSQYLNWSDFFIKQVNVYIQKAQQSQKLKFGRICKILGLSLQGFDPIVIQELRSVLPRNKKLRFVE